MDLTWWVVVIAGCVALAGVILAVLLRPVETERRLLRPLANVSRLTRLPEYVRAVRSRTTAAVATMVLLVVMFAGAVVVAARPTGLPSWATHSGAGDPEDIMVCVGGPPTTPAASAALRYFADTVTGFDTQRIALTSTNRRVIPLTRDYQHAKAQFATYAAEQQGDSTRFSAPVSYLDYAESVEDLLALCLTGFPAFDETAAQRRSLIYVGPDTLRAPGESRPALFTFDRISELATAAGVQVNVLTTGSDSDALSALAKSTGGQFFSAQSNVSAHLAEIRANPPAPRSSEKAAVAMSSDSPDIPLLVALLASVALVVWPLVQRR